MKDSTSQSRMRRSLLAACLAVALGAGDTRAEPAGGAGYAESTASPDFASLASWIRSHAGPAPAGRGGAVHVVAHCDDDGPGSLRQAVLDAASGDTIDMGSLACSTISLTTGAIVTAANDLALIGPGRDSLAIDAGHTSRVLVHAGNGQLYARGFTVVNGAKYAGADNDASGGCIHSQGYVVMSDAAAVDCLAQADGNGDAFGGAIYARDGAALLHSVVSGSRAHAVSGSAFGGGLYTAGGASVKYGIFRDNIASSGTDSGFGGAAIVGGGASIGFSTVHGNTADHIGGLGLTGSGATAPLAITHSTIADNHALASALGSGVFVGADASITNSTITGNSEMNAAGTKYGAGLSAKYGTTIDLRSTIVSGNTITDGEAHLPSDIGAALGGDPPTITGSNNLVGSSASELPPDTRVTSFPELGPLADNGGPTPTMLPRSASMAIDAGEAMSDVDQRGQGFPRLVGTGVDIGAVESDVIFADGFD